MVKSQIAQIIGKRITGILVSEHEKSPEQQIVLVFDDETFYEFYGRISTAGDSDQGGIGAAIYYAEAFRNSRMTWYGDRKQVEKVLPEARYRVGPERM